MTKFLARPECTCFHSDKDGHGEAITNSAALTNIELFIEVAQSQGICDKALYITAVKSFSGILGGIASIHCKGDQIAAELLVTEYLKQLTEDINHFRDEVQHHEDREGKRMQ